MADKKISALTASSTPLAGTEVLPIVQSGSTVKVSVSDLTAGRVVSASGAAVNATFKAWSVVNAYQVGTGASFGGGVGFADGFATCNSYYDGANWKRIVAAGASQVALTPSTGLRFNIAGTGTADSTMTWTEVGSFSALADFTVNSGNVVIGTAGKGIDFSANGGDVLSQYDEGTYTPVFTASTSNPTVTYGLQRGKYVRIGNTVTVSVFITWSAFSGGSGDLQISLPFAGESSVGAGAAGAIADLTGFTFAAGRTFCSVRPNANVLYATFPQSGSLVSTSNTTVAQTASSGLIVFSCTYLI